MRAVLLPGDKRVIIADRPIPKPGPGQVLIKTAASAICRSDMSIYYGNPIVGGGDTKELITPGHEAAGEVVKVGPGVRSIKVGDRVASYLAVADAQSEFSMMGLPMLDPQWRCFGFDLDGGDADYFVLPEVNCLSLPAEISFKAGAVLTDMVGTQYHTQKRLGVSARNTVGVIGLGPMGAAAVQIARALGARIIAVDVLESRLEQARELGSHAVINSAKTNPVDEMRRLTGGRGPDIIIECSGNPQGQNTALDAVAKLGAVAFVGESRATEINPSDQIIRKMLTVIGGWYFPRGEWEEIVRFVAEKAIPVEKLISHEFAIEQAEEAFGAFDRRETEKAVFVW
jgi:threonine dehydrogenase-like Zn-dependent dehydrogenase